ncbi:ArsR/SmtB family transcription factor [Albidovulum sp.]|uniref:ArsR/SmtB family transcription factor n=1 Tax=Albidovulum sp. TaxID=1872424 RepID=UPI0039B8B499
MARSTGGNRREGTAGGAGRPPSPPPIPAPLTESVALQADAAAIWLKALSHEGRLMILCHLIEGEKSVTDLEALLSTRQSAISQQLARLRLEGLVTARRDGKAIYYSLGDSKTRRMIAVLSELFCR